MPWAAPSCFARASLSSLDDVAITVAPIKRANVQGISVGSTQMFEALNRAIAAGAMKPVIDKVFPFDDTPAAFKYLQSAQHIGKIVISLA